MGMVKPDERPFVVRGLAQMTIQRTGGGPYSFSQVVVHGDVVYLAGQVAARTASSKPVRDQIRMVFARIDELLESAGSRSHEMLSVTVLLKDIGDFGVLNEEWDAWVDPDALPARATFQAPLRRPNILVELVVYRRPRGAASVGVRGGLRHGLRAVARGRAAAPRGGPADQYVLERVVGASPRSCAAGSAARTRARRSQTSTSRAPTGRRRSPAQVAPDSPWAWDPRVVVDAAFGRYVRGARGLRRAAGGSTPDARSSSVVVVVAGAADHDLVLLDRDLDRRWPAQCSA